MHFHPDAVNRKLTLGADYSSEKPLKSDKHTAPAINHSSMIHTRLNSAWGFVASLAVSFRSSFSRDEPIILQQRDKPVCDTEILNKPGEEKYCGMTVDKKMLKNILDGNIHL